jgi:hypothetical protein
VLGTACCGLCDIAQYLRSADDPPRLAALPHNAEDLPGNHGAVDATSFAARPALVEPSPRRQRSRITNGRALLPGIDGRSAWTRRAKDVIAAHIADLGGVDNTSAAERSLIRRAGILTVELERLEAKFANSDTTDLNDLDTYGRTAGNLRRMLEAIGLKRRARDITTPDPLTYESERTP